MAGRVWHSVRNALRAIREGELLLRLRADKYLVHILYLFILMWVTIFLGIQVDKTLIRVKENNEELEKLRIYRTEKEAELVKLHSASAAQKRLKELGSEATLPTEPTSIIKTK
ncbi:MAG: hypothetical protein IK008_01495 [Bacteroidales bacterium]|nr:hypothetical protein [Bacteroidales bacterium]